MGSHVNVFIYLMLEMIMFGVLFQLFMDWEGSSEFWKLHPTFIISKVQVNFYDITPLKDWILNTQHALHNTKTHTKTAVASEISLIFKSHWMILHKKGSLIQSSLKSLTGSLTHI